MKNATFLFYSLIFALLIMPLAGCNKSNYNHDPDPYADPHNGRFVLTLETLQGNCEEFANITVKVWEGSIYDDLTDPEIEVAGGLLESDTFGNPPRFYALVDFTASAEDEGAVDVELDGVFPNSYSMAGEWRLIDGACYGSISGVRLE